MQRNRQDASALVLELSVLRSPGFNDDDANDDDSMFQALHSKSPEDDDAERVAHGRDVLNRKHCGVLPVLKGDLPKRSYGVVSCVGLNDFQHTTYTYIIKYSI